MKFFEKCPLWVYCPYTLLLRYSRTSIIAENTVYPVFTDSFKTCLSMQQRKDYENLTNTPVNVKLQNLLYFWKYLIVYLIFSNNTKIHKRVYSVENHNGVYDLF